MEPQRRTCSTTRTPERQRAHENLKRVELLGLDRGKASSDSGNWWAHKQFERSYLRELSTVQVWAPHGWKAPRRALRSCASSFLESCLSEARHRQRSAVVLSARKVRASVPFHIPAMPSFPLSSTVGVFSSLVFHICLSCRLPRFFSVSLYFFPVSGLLPRRSFPDDSQFRVGRQLRPSPIRHVAVGRGTWAVFNFFNSLLPSLCGSDGHYSSPECFPPVRCTTPLGAQFCSVFDAKAVPPSVQLLRTKCKSDGSFSGFLALGAFRFFGGSCRTRPSLGAHASFAPEQTSLSLRTALCTCCSLSCLSKVPYLSFCCAAAACHIRHATTGHASPKNDFWFFFLVFLFLPLMLWAQLPQARLRRPPSRDRLECRRSPCGVFAISFLLSSFPP